MYFFLSKQKKSMFLALFSQFSFNHNDLFNHRGQWSVLLFAVLLLSVDISYSFHISNSSAGTWAAADAATGGCFRLTPTPGPK